jgi:hypothetical protein
MYNCIFNCYKSKNHKDIIDKNIDNYYPKQKNINYTNNVKLPKEWIEKCSQSGEPYWYNINTHEKTFNKPNKQIYNVI